MKAKFLALVLFVVFLFPHSLSAQGFFKGIGVPAAVASTGQTEALGLIIVAMTNGSFVGDTLVINLFPLQITNTNASDIVVRANGLIIGSPTIDTTNDVIQIAVPRATASSGSISIQGIRVAVAGTGINSFNAQLSWLNLNNVFIDGVSVPVISSVQTALTARSIATLAASGQSTIQVAEGFLTAFSSSSQYGQTGPTQIRLTVTDVPAGTQLQFPATITANETAATLTSSGGSLTLTGNGTVTYSFSAAGNSDTVAESFNINAIVPAFSAQPTFRATLAPIGAAVPTSALPSTSIPRYAEAEILVEPASSLVPQKFLYWTGMNPSLQNQIEVTNPASRASKLTIDAFDLKGNAISGTGVTSPVTMTLAATQSFMSSMSNLFGTAAGISSIRIQSTTPDLLAAGLTSGNGVNQAVPFVSVPVTSLIFPIVSDGAQLYIMNTTAKSITGTVTLLTEAGDVVSGVTINLGPLASTVVAAQTAFGKPPQSGYASAVFSDSVIAYESFGRGNLEPVQLGTPQGTLFVPFIAGGSSFKPSVKLLNLSRETVNLTARLFATNGSPLAAQPLTMPPAGQIVESMQEMFSQSPDAAYVELDVAQTGKAFFVSYPLVGGQAQIETLQGGSTVIPLSVNQSVDAFILGQAISPAGFEGIAFLNPTTSNVTVTARVLKFDGSVAATATLTLAPRQLAAQVTDQLFNGALPAQTVIHVTSSAPIAVTAITGSNALDQILALPVMW